MGNPITTPTNTTTNGTNSPAAASAATADGSRVGEDPYVRIDFVGSRPSERRSERHYVYHLTKTSVTAQLTGIWREREDPETEPVTEDFPLDTTFTNVRPSMFTADGLRVPCTHHLNLPERQSAFGLGTIPKSELLVACIGTHDPNCAQDSNAVVYGPVLPPNFSRASNVSKNKQD
jgi:hypothetical protein